MTTAFEELLLEELEQDARSLDQEITQPRAQRLPPSQSTWDDFESLLLSPQRSFQPVCVSLMAFLRVA